jgi:hypothetical protein
MGSPPYRRRYGRRANPFDISLPPEDPSVVGQSRRITTLARRSMPRFRAVGNILQDARLPYTTTVPGQYPTTW